MSHLQIVPISPLPAEAVDPVSADEEQAPCPLFQICEQLIEQFREAGRDESDGRGVLRWLEQRIASTFGFNNARSLLLAKLAFELMHLQVHGRFESSDVEVACLISRVTEGWVEPGAN